MLLPFRPTEVHCYSVPSSQLFSMASCSNSLLGWSRRIGSLSRLNTLFALTVFVAENDYSSRGEPEESPCLADLWCSTLSSESVVAKRESPGGMPCTAFHQPVQRSRLRL